MKESLPQLPLVLVVDDTPTNIETLIAVLEGHYEISAATSGQQALALLARGLRPDLILLDVMMPEMDGYAVCAALKAIPALTETPVLFLTAKTDTGSEAHALAIGAVDFIHKPISPAVVRARIALHLGLVRQRRNLEQLNQRLTQSLHDQRQAEEALAEVRQREMAISSVIQQQLLFGAPPEDLAGFTIASYTEPSQGVAGDFFTYTRLGRYSFEVLTGDVMGKGIPAALIAAGVKSSYLKARATLGPAHPLSAAPSAADLINAIHQDLTPELIKLNSFVTMALLRFDYMARTVVWVNAGHTPALLGQVACGTVRPLLGDNLPIGVLPQEQYEEHRVAFEAGDTLLLYSDGLSESLDAAKQPFGDSPIHALLAQSVAQKGDAHSTLGLLRSKLDEFTLGAPAVDDRTVVVVQSWP